MSLSVIAAIAAIIGAAATVATYITQANLSASHTGVEVPGRRAESKALADSDTTMAGKPAKDVRSAERESKHKRLDVIRQRIASWTRRKVAGAALSLGVISGLIVYGMLYVTLAPSPQLTVTASCAVVSGQMVPGAIIRITYHINANESFQAGLGAGLYDNAGHDHSTGYGDLSDLPLPKGPISASRPVLLPPKLPAGYYEITGEIWPANEIGQNGVNTYADPTCGYFTVR
ncbi:MAG TPA: hypothetical protein VME44_18545 [Streptosporangiaceae bacterium]|nr:hypothetical protein [Streptosporangiaceae bacterium]